LRALEAWFLCARGAKKNANGPHLLPITCGVEYMVQAKLLDAPSIRWWFSFLGLFLALFDKIHDLFYVTEIFDTLVSHEKVSSTLTQLRRYSEPLGSHKND
jgi:hypothetical protein